MSDFAPSRLESHLGYWLRRVSNRVSEEFARGLAARNVSVAEWVALRHLYDHAQLAPSVLADSVGMTQGAISKISDKLRAKGWVVVIENEADRRGQFLVLTGTGRKAVPELAAIADANDERFFGPLTEDERSTLLRLMERLSQIHAWDDVPTT